MSTYPVRLRRLARRQIDVRHRGAGLAAFALLLCGIFIAVATGAETWRGLVVATEHRCSPYDRKRDYPYPQSIERQIVQALGAVYGPYTGTRFVSTGETDIDHILAASEAHDSGLWARDRATRVRFASDLRNLTLASPHINRYKKSGKDAAEWLPDRNRSWFAARIIEVRQAHKLTIDRREADTLEQILRRCETFDLEPMVCHAKRTTGNQNPRPVGGSDNDALARYDDNRNGRITCKEARRHAIAPVHQDHPAYRFMRDADADGVVCEGETPEPVDG